MAFIPKAYHPFAVLSLYYLWKRSSKCNCNNCSTHLEFDSASAGQFITCPSCGMETKLYVPPSAPVPKVEKPAQKSSAPIANPLTSGLPPAESLKRVRQQTCYEALRTLIGIAQIICFIMAALPVLAGVFGFYSEVREGGMLAVAGGFVAIILLSVFWMAVFVFLAIASKQAALLLVDIADCQIQLVGKSS